MKLLLDTNALVFLQDSGYLRFRDEIIEKLSHAYLFLSPISWLELEHIFQKKRIAIHPDTLIKHLTSNSSLQESTSTFSSCIHYSRNLSWTKDPFDRMIVGDTIALGAQLVTADKLILKHFNQASGEKTQKK